MDWIVQKLWLIPALPLVAAGLSALLKQRQRRLAAALAIGAMVLALVLSCMAFVSALQHPGHGSVVRQGVNFFWFQFGDPRNSDAAVWLGWVLDPLTAVMLVMTCWRMPCSEYCSRFLATRTFSRVWSIQKLFSNGWVSLIAPTWPEEFWNGRV